MAIARPDSTLEQGVDVLVLGGAAVDEVGDDRVGFYSDPVVDGAQEGEGSPLVFERPGKPPG